MTPNVLTRIALILPSLAVPTLAQEAIVPAAVAPAPTVIPGEYIVHHADALDLSTLRDAIHSGASVDAVDAIVAGLEAKVAAERESFVEAIEKLGGTVEANYWIIDASHVKIADAKIDAVRDLAGVTRVERNMIHAPVLATSTNSNNHNSDAANTVRGLTSGQLVVGTDLTVAILDTGIDSDMAGQQRPHRSFYKGGNPNNTSGAGLNGSRVLGRFVASGAAGNGEDDHGHGTACASCSAGAAWPGNDAGFAPDANIVSWKVSSNSGGGANTTALTNAWQQTLSNVTRYKIVAANNSYSGSPSMTSSTQQAADRLAYVGNVNVCVPAGNSATNIGATQAGYNGLNCGSNNKNTSSRSSFSGVGTQSTGKIIPDIAAIGASVNMTRKDSESSVNRWSGTSFSSPTVAGAAVLVRHANPNIGALETKALLLNNTRPQTMVSGLGAGVLRADLAVNAAIKSEVELSKLDATTQTKDYFFTLSQGVRHSVTLTWWRKATSTSANNDLSLTIYNASNVIVASSNRSSANSYEKVEFVAPAAGTYRARVAGTRVDSTVDFAIAGAGKSVPPKKPVLSAIAPSSVEIRSTAFVTLTGTELQGVTEVIVGAQSVTAQNVTSTQVQFVPPIPTQLGPVSVKVRNGGGDSNALTMTFLGKHPPLLLGPAILVSNGFYTDSFICDENWIGLHYISTSNTPSKITGVVDLGIGNSFQNLILFNTFVGDKAGNATVQWIMPTGFASLKFYSQVVAIDGKTFKLPFESSNILSRTVIF